MVAELSAQQTLDLYAMREVLEGAAARFAAQHAAPGELAVMRQLLDDFSEAAADAPRLAHVNRALHQTICEAARNRYVQEALDNLDDALSLLRNTTFSLPDRHGPADREHRAIVAAIAARDADKAEAAARAHIREAQRARLRLLKGIDRTGR